MNDASHRYGLVRAIAFILKLLAWAALILGVLAFIVALVNPSGQGIFAAARTAGLIVGPVVGIVWFVQLYAFGSILSLLVEIEENTRQLAAGAPAAS